MPEYAELLREAMKRYFERLYAPEPPIRPETNPLPYDACPLIEKVNWRLPFGELLVGHELQEVTNGANHWWGSLRRWNAWTDVLDGYAEDEAFDVQWEFVEPVAFHCLFQPSATRDRLTLAATNALHQALLTRDPGYPDRLAGDKLKKDGTPQPLHRAAAETRLAGLVSHWTAQTEFVAALQSVDSAAYRDKTANFRNLASHAIAPRLTWGYTNIIRRVLVPGPPPSPSFPPESSQLGSADGGAHKVGHHVEYPLGGTPPIPMREAFELNLAEYERAADAIARYRLLLEEVLQQLSRK